MTILNQTEIMQSPLWMLIACIVLMILGIALLLIGRAVSNGKLILSSLPVFSLVILISILSGVCKSPTGRYRYECTIDSKTSVSEIYENYKIVERHGDLWVLEDKAEE